MLHLFDLHHTKRGAQLIQSVYKRTGKRLNITSVRQSHVFELGLKKMCLVDRFFCFFSQLIKVFYLVDLKSEIKMGLYYSPIKYITL